MDTPVDNVPVVDPFSVLPDQQNSATGVQRISHSLNSNQVDATTTRPNSLADSEGDHSPQLRKASARTADTPDATTQINKLRVQQQVVNDFNKPQTMTSNSD